MTAHILAKKRIAQLGSPICMLLLILFLSCGQSAKNSSTNNISETTLNRGKKLYETNCSVCHQSEGQGIGGTFPPLTQTGWVLGSKERLISVVLKGLDEKIRVHGEVYDAVMPAMDHLSDEQVADILTYIRNSFGNKASKVTNNEVKLVRAGQTLNEPVSDFSDVKPSNDYKARKKMIKNRTESRVGSHYSKGELQMDQITVIPGFKLEVFAQGLQKPRSLALGSKGTIFVGTRRNDTDFIYAIKDLNGDWKPDTIIQISKGLKWNPMGVAVRGDDLYVGEIDRIVKYANIEDQLDNIPEPELVFNYPPEKKHGEKYIRFGPDDKLYVPVGAPCNNCLEENPIFASITRIDPDGSNFEIYAHGVRNSRGFDWHPETGQLWFSDNGRDLLEDDLPPCEINLAPEPGMHFGYPFCHGAEISDPEFGPQRPCSDFTAQAFGLVAHAAPVSLLFYTGNMFPKEFKGRMLVSEHGSWNRKEKQGYRIMMLTLEGNRVVNYEPFAYGWLDPSKNDAWGRPVDLLQMPDGSLLISDDHAGAIYRISYQNNQDS
ncbi:MAG: PQQ-dependent sugar dehydrogenase [Cyclobacteriaceae bacterium]|nr:PQQ-dependent sugar dehydrogenase [Cyclobacteriaceae bacterium HetDA_MAG_MS6]